MFGYLRFLLANLVLLSHTGANPSWGNVGAISVVIFYMLSGYANANIFANCLNKNKIKNFYLDRITRIFPLYIVILIIYIFILNFYEFSFGFLEIFLNSILIPCNYLRYPIIPVSWSLSLEFQAYLLLPFLFRKRLILNLLGSASLLIFLLSNLSFLDKYDWGYYKLPGVFFIFIIGALFVLNKGTIFLFIICSMVVLFSITGMTLIELGIINRGGFQSEVLLGISLGILLIYLLKNKRKVIFDKELGSISYGVFLIHYLFIIIFSKLHIGHFLFNVIVIIASFTASYLLYYLFEKKITEWRIKKS